MGDTYLVAITWRSRLEIIRFPLCIFFWLWANRGLFFSSFWYLLPFLTFQLWDINMDSGPVASYQVHEHLRPRVRASFCGIFYLLILCWKLTTLCFTRLQLCDLYENDSIFDKFECCLSGDGLRVATGSYRLTCLSSGHCCTFLSCIRNKLMTNLLYLISGEPAIYSAYLERLKEVLKLRLWKLAKTRWGKSENREHW